MPGPLDNSQAAVDRDATGFEGHEEDDSGVVELGVVADGPDHETEADADVAMMRPVTTTRTPRRADDAGWGSDGPGIDLLRTYVGQLDDGPLLTHPGEL